VTIREYLSYLLIVLEHVRPKQPLRLDVVRETKEEVLEVLVFGFRPHVVQGLIGNVQILGLTQSATFRVNAGSANKDRYNKWNCLHCSDARSGSLSGFVDVLDELPLLPASVLDRGPVSDGLQIGRDPRIVSGFNEVVEARLEFLDDPLEEVRGTFNECGRRTTHSSSPQMAAILTTSVLSLVVLGCSPVGYSKPKRFTRGRYTCYMDELMKWVTKRLAIGYSPSRIH